MKATLIGFVLLLGVAGCGTRQAPLATRQDRFINVIRVLADSGRLTDRQEVERLLGTKLIVKKTYESVKPLGECDRNPNSSRMYSSVSYEADPTFWFKETADGRPGLAYPNWMLPGNSYSGSPTFSYEVVRTLACSENEKADPAIEATVYFQSIATFLCITKYLLHHALPEVKDIAATDGAIVYVYNSEQKDTRVFFDFIHPVECISSIRLEQGPGVRLNRAKFP